MYKISNNSFFKENVSTWYGPVGCNISDFSDLNWVPETP